MSLPEILLRLKAHPDSARPASEPEATRVTGFLGLQTLEGGGLRALWPWGFRTFASQAELEGWLCGRIPASWQT